MTPNQAEELLRTLRRKALTLEELHDRVRTSGSTWTVDQLHLFLLCAPGVHHDAEAGTFRVHASGGDEDLREAVIEAVRSFAGKPVPASEIRKRLPVHFVTTDEQIHALVRRSQELELFGPGLIRIAKGDHR